jgi:hypothetical protein
MIEIGFTDLSGDDAVDAAAGLGLVMFPPVPAVQHVANVQHRDE